MKLKNLSYSLSKLGFMSSMLLTAQVFAGDMGPVACASGKAYLSIFGGAGSSRHVDVSQFGTAYFTEAEGGPLAVDSFGTTNSRRVGFLGGQVGYQWSEIALGAFNSGLSPAVELEGYSLNRKSFTAQDINNNTLRLPEHNFVVTYPIKGGIFLANAVANFNPSSFNRFHPYVGAGIGAAVLSITNASSIQISPAEPGINHYNSSTSDKDATFAGQIKAGLNVDVSQHFSIFAEYRWLYLASTSYAFGSTVYPTHAPTSNWLVALDSQKYNLGAIGLRFSI